MRVFLQCGSCGNFARMHFLCGSPISHLKFLVPLPHVPTGLLLGLYFEQLIKNKKNIKNSIGQYSFLPPPSQNHKKKRSCLRIAFVPEFYLILISGSLSDPISLRLSCLDISRSLESPLYIM